MLATTRFCRIVAASVAAVGAALVPSALWASADTTCTPKWRLDARDLDCNGTAMLSPANDTRTNLLLLVRDRSGTGLAGLKLPATEWETRGYGATFFDWRFLTATYYPAADEGEDTRSYVGSRCASVSGANAAFAAALASAKGISATDRELLTSARTQVEGGCKESPAAYDWPVVSGKPAQEFLTYLQAARAFYQGQWGDAATGFGNLAGASDPWLRETAVYMTARNALNLAQDQAFNEWGDFVGGNKIDKGLVAAARKALEAYVAAWPGGRYASSARGLVRRTHWLLGDGPALAAAYEAALASADGASSAAADLVQEADAKFLMGDGAANAASGPLLLATLDLYRLRGAAEADGGLPLAARADQRRAFAGNAALLGFLEASHAYYAAADMKRVLALIPDEARQPSYGPIAFSRQMLRGMALNELRDANAVGFWRDLIGGSAAVHQRPLAELGLAMALERAGRVGDVFAAGSLVQDTTLREVLLQSAAGPEVLRAQAGNTSRPTHERDLALFALLYKQLTRGRYAAFASDADLVRPEAKTETWLYNFQNLDNVPVGIFVRGRMSDGFACPAIAQTAQALAARPADPKARLCLGDFLRLNGFDGFTQLDDRPDPAELGGGANDFPGKPLVRGAIYAAIIADRTAPADARAYAMYRRIACYAPSGNNSCGDGQVDPDVRKAWYDQLKREYPASPWARKLRYWW